MLDKIRIQQKKGTVIVIVIVIGGLKSTGLTRPHIVGTEKVPPVGTPTIRGLSTLRDAQKLQIAYPNFRLALFGAFLSFRPISCN